MTPFPALAAALMLAWPVRPVTVMTLHVALCNGGSTDIPIDRDQRDRSCPSACHAMLCHGRKRAGSV
ncbi:hypothetical protein HJG53_05920 [Sphingomonas sp. ID1715]|uniref:hypothetical protein n=1 Tax=Sphingomonas sp. ID1715 TaxID=1656898 RepID=UPI001487E390|nr:hypothetical protein [Sphingomonas sp. ID1715]NNM76437.1 hypothetical protein [Sphingomonas sp. ID1715]